MTPVLFALWTLALAGLAALILVGRAAVAARAAGGAVRFWLDYGSKIVVLRIFRLDLFTYWKRYKR